MPAFRHCAVLTHNFTVMRQVDRDVETRQRNAANNFIDMVKFGFLGAQEFAPRRGVVEQIQHLQRRSHRMRRRFNRYVHIAPFGIGLPGFLLFCDA